MIVVRDIERIPAEARGGALTIGNFDGVHRGHARIVSTLRAMADRRQGPAVVFTFDPPPSAIIRPHETPRPLTWLERKAELLEALGVDALIVYPTDRALLSLSAEAFFEQVVRGQFDARGMVEGPNFCFGSQRRGDVRLLGQLCDVAGVDLEIVEPLRDGDQYVSSSRVRALLSGGDVAAAGQLLTRPYRVRGRVVRGAARGAKLGFPTANLADVPTLVPGPGVYAGRTWIDATPWPVAMHLGPVPTFEVRESVVEAHVIGFAGDLYDRVLDVEFLERLRDVRPFPSVDALREQLAFDIERARVCVVRS